MLFATPVANFCFASGLFQVVSSLLMKLLNGKELAGFIKERQSHQVRSIDSKLKLAIVKTLDDPRINTYVRLKKRYGEKIGVDVDIHTVEQKEVNDLVSKLNKDDGVTGIIIQLPLDDTSQTDELLNLVDPSKDVDGLHDDSPFDPATPTAILWLLAGYNVELRGKQILVIGEGKLVGSPLIEAFKSMELNVVSVNKETEDVPSITRDSEIIVTAAGVSGLLTSDMISPDTVIVDAGVAVESGKTVGDVAEEVYERDDLTITPQKGGVGPLTVCALFENVIKAHTTT